MTANGLLQIALFSAIVLAITRPLGGYITRVIQGERVFLTPVFRPVETVFYWLAGVDEKSEQHWLRYGASVLFFSFAGVALLYAMLRLQPYLPFNPQGFGAVEPLLAFNTAVSFVTNTNWQNYGGETSMSYFVQMAGLTVHNFVSAATGIALAIAFIRGFSRTSANSIGNFWVDLTRISLYVLLPVSIVVGLFFVWQGMPQTLGSYVDATTLQGAHQSIAIGPVASQEVIKMFGTNGGGFFNANSAHPFENPNAVTNLIQMVLIFAIGAALTNVFGRMVGNQRQGWALFGVMAILFLAGTLICYYFEAGGNPNIAAFGVDQSASLMQAGGNMEGKDVRFGIANSTLFAVVTTDASCGAVNSWHDSYTPLGGMIPLINMQLGEIIFGGVGSGLYGMLLYAIVGVFICGLMVGRTPEYVGKKIEAYDVKMTALAIICLPFSILGFTALATALPVGVSSIANAGPHGFSEILYAFSSATGNNGSAFGGLSGNTPFYNITLGLAMLIGRFAVIVPMLAVAGSLARKGKVAASAGTFPTDSGMWVAILVSVILVVGGLTFFPALSLGPIVEHFAMTSGTLY